MKRIFLLIMAIFYFSLCPSSLWAASRSVTITWTMSDTASVQGYKVYYADNSAMANEIWHSNCSTPIENPTNTFTIVCNNIDLIGGQTYYFAIAAQMSDSSETISNPREKTVTSSTVTITTVQNFRITTSSTIPHPDNATPVAYFKLEAAGGINADQIYDEVTQTWMGSGANTMQFIQGNEGNCIKVAERDDKILLPAALITNQDTVTLEFEVKYDTLADSLFPVGFNEIGQSNVLAFNTHYWSNGPRVYYARNYTGISYNFDPYYDATVNTWINYKIIICFSRHSIEIIKDGTSMGVWSNPNLVLWGNASGNVILGFHDSTDPTALFYLDEVKIYHGEVR